MMKRSMRCLAAAVVAVGGSLAAVQESHAATQDLLMVNATGNNVLRFDGVTGEYIGEFVTAGSGGLATPIAATYGPDGNLYVSSSGSNQILKYDGVTGASLGVAVTGVTQPYGVLFDSNGNFLIGRTAHGPVQRYDSSGVALPGNGETGANFTDVTPPVGDAYNRLRHQVLDGAGNLFSSETDDNGGNEIYKFNAATGDLISVLVNVSVDSASPEGSQLILGPSFNDDGTPDLYVTVQGGISKVHVYDTTSGSLLGAIDLAFVSATFNPRGLAFNPNNPDQLIVVSGNSQGTRAFTLDGDGGYVDDGAFLTGGPGVVRRESIIFMPVIPEPASLGLMGLGALALLARRSRSK